MLSNSTIYDPVHRIITFSRSPSDRLLQDLINTKEFQRLRRIRQLGMCSLVFPGAEHSRFSHSLGVLYNARRFLEQLNQCLPPDAIDSEHKTLVLAAALLHDIGHGPFSHAFEKITEDKHEKRTREIICDSGTRINAVLKKYSATFPERLAAFFDPYTADKPKTDDVPKFLKQVVSSQLDADRFDYLIRDSHMTGMTYGRFDTDWIIQHIRLDNAKPDSLFYIDQKAFVSVEAYIFARHHMYQTVYFHKTIRAAEIMLRLLFQRFKELLHDPECDQQQFTRAQVPEAVRLAFSGKMKLDQYLSLDDHSIGAFFKSCQEVEDGWLRWLGVGLLNRTLYKALDVTGVNCSKIARFNFEARSLMIAKNFDHNYSLVEDQATDLPYSPYDPARANSDELIYVSTLSEGKKEISSQSEAVSTLQKKYTFHRYFFPPILAPEMEEIWKRLMKADRPH